MKNNKTVNKIIDSAIDIFSEYPYEEVALTQISTLANISSGSIYNYFKTKEELFKFLLKETVKRLKIAFTNIHGNTEEERLKNFIALSFTVTKKEFKLIKIYREGQYKFIEFEQKLRKIYIKALEQIFQKSISEVEYLYIMSGIRFINVNFTKSNSELDIDFLSKIILKGAFEPCQFKVENFKNKPLYQISPLDNENKKIQLLQCGENLFGEFGYHNTKISDITKVLNISVGSFYSYYPNKESFLTAITEHLTNSVLFFLKYNIDESTPLLVKHLELLYLVVIFFQSSPYRYEIIREAEFVSDSISKKYFSSLENLYIGTFSETNFSLHEKKILSNFLMGISHYIGIELFFTKNIKDKNRVLTQLSQYLSSGITQI